MPFVPKPLAPSEVVHADSERPCLACGYSLRGLADCPRCPECGLLNIPDGFRAQVWELVDSGVWLFSSMFHPLKKRPPGWWWALDRENDARRSLRFVAKNVCVATLVLLTGAVLADGLMLQRTRHFTCVNINDASAQPVYEAVWIETICSIGGRNPEWGRGKQPSWVQLFVRDRKCAESELIGIVFIPSWHSLLIGGLLSIWVYLVWAGPGLVGLWTQIRKGLPKFALARRTIISAVSYESHRMIYVAITVIAGLGIECAMRLQGLVYSAPFAYPVAFACIVLAVVVLAAGGWIGPLRSDFTKQLIRSRLHMLRILLMYATVLPLAFFVSISALLGLLAGWW